ncbi:MAG: S8 family serine peptidase [Bacteroidales bacterium]|nr:S8 family serine peptidase [Bacteroidales bacterium]
MIKYSFYLIVFIIFLSLPFVSISQSHYPGMFLVSFTDKNQSPYSINQPKQYMSARAIMRRSQADIPIIEQDLPANPKYIDSLAFYGVQVSFSSKWLNAVLVRMDDSLNMEALLKISFVDSMQYLAPVKSKKKKRKKTARLKRVETGVQYQHAEYLKYGASDQQLDLIGLKQMHRKYLGEDIHIAVLDNGFRGMNKMSVFETLFDNGQVLGTKDIVNPQSSVFSAGNHGTYVMTTMAAFEPLVLVGSAPAASYWLIHTEDNTYEYPIEEFNWLVGAEFADSVGADIITSSLIYSTFDNPSLDHTHEQLDGKSAIVSRAAQIATEKGIMVFNSAGNDALKSWHTIAFPADAKDIITVGAVDMKAYYALFSSVGRSNNLPIKPNVVAVGKGVQSMSPNTGEIVSINGTSFSNPTIAGAAAVLMQANPNASIKELKIAIEQSASQALFPDSILGYGIPNFYLAHVLLNKQDVDDFKSSEGFTVMPNPFINDFFIVYNLIDTPSVSMQVFDISGKLAFEMNNLPNSLGLNLFKIDKVDALSQGVFILVLHIGDKKYSKKIVKK